MIEIAADVYASWEGALEARVAAFTTALAEHQLSIGQPAPAEHELVERIVRAGGMEQVTILPPPNVTPGRREIPTLAFRRRFTLAERAAFTLAAAQTLAGGDPTLQVALDDLGAAQEIDLDDPEVAQVLAALVAAGLLEPDRPAEILA